MYRLIYCRSRHFFYSPASALYSAFTHTSVLSYELIPRATCGIDVLIGRVDTLLERNGKGKT